MDDKSKIILNKEFNEFILTYENSIMVEIFYIQLITKFSCKCGYITNRFQKVLDLPILIPESINKFSLIELFDYNFKKEVVEFNTKCIKYNNINKHLKKVKISIIPDTLIISLQRFDKIKKIKNVSAISITNKINIVKYIYNEIIRDNEIEYELYGIINHEGSLDFGHYYSFIKSFASKMWYNYNDVDVNEINFNSDYSNKVYILLYTKKI